MRHIAPFLALLASPACATAPAAAPVETITFETGPCFGACPVYRLVLNSDGGGTFEGRRFTGVAGMRPIRVTPAQYRAFAAELAPLRPARGNVRSGLDGIGRRGVLST